jgi:hypothetical protein
LPDGYICPTALDAIAEDNVYQCIVDSSAEIARGGQTYSVTANVQDYYLMEDLVSITDDPSVLPEGWFTGLSSFKAVELTVSWVSGDDDRPGFQGAPEDDVHLGSGALTVSSIIPSIPNLGSAKIAEEPDDEEGTVIPYQPGQRPDIVRLDLNGGKFKESTTPRPDVVRSDSLAETWFDVITYNQSGDASFLRREEFLVISCECELMAADENNLALLPTVWTGLQYSEEEWAEKPYGVSANNQQSFYCDTCCRDHHDISTTNADKVYDPARLDNRPNWSMDGGIDGDHDHFERITQGNKAGLTSASVGDTYVEACRMVRKDGFMRVAQDVRQAGFLGFPEGFLDTPDGAGDYASYVTAESAGWYTANYGVNGRNPAMANNNLQDRLDAPLAARFPGDSSANATTLPFLGLNSQQMRSRGVYLDHLTQPTLELIGCINRALEDGGDVAEDCNAPGVTNVLQVMPFFELQTTWLSFWDAMGDPVSVTNEAVADDNGHSRGYALLTNESATATSLVNSRMFRGNIGLSVTDPITVDEEDAGNSDVNEDSHSLYVAVNGGGDGTIPAPMGYIWEADFGSAVNRVEVSDTIVTPLGNEYCTRTSTMLRCITPVSSPGNITISGLTKLQGQTYIPLYVCVAEPDGQSLFDISTVFDGVTNTATLSWSAPAGNVDVTLSLSIEDENCGP